MHELSLMEALRPLVLREAARAGGRRITGLHLRLGELAGVEPAALDLAATVVLADTIAAGARLMVEVVPAEGCCGGCGRSVPLPGGVGRCPCGAAGAIRVVQGMELQLVGLDLL